MTRFRWTSGVPLVRAAALMLPIACAFTLTVSLLAQSAQELYQRGLVEEHSNGNLKQAIALYAQVSKAAGNDRALAARALQRMGESQEKLGEEAAAAGTYAELVRAYPEQRTEVARAQERLTQFRQAETQSSGAPNRVTAASGSSSTRQFVESFCVSCHNGKVRTAGLDLEALVRANVSENTASWETVTRRLKARRDPPLGMPRPDEATFRSVITRLEQALDAAYAARRASVPLQRAPDEELASRVAAFIWNGPPDAALLSAARRGALRDPAALRREVLRMLRDAKSVGLVDTFFTQWLALDKIKTIQPDATIFPQFDAELLQSMESETRLFLQSQLRDDRDAVELWTANYTFANERLGRHYGLSGITGKEMQRIALPDKNRAGLLGQAGPLSAVSFATRTSPTVRGRYVLSHFFGIEAPQPPANVPALPERPPARAGTMRDRVIAHQANASCASCHILFDPLGFALENFDAVGAWRLTDGGGPIDASGRLVDGTVFDGPAGLRTALLKYREAYYGNLASQLLAAALSRKGKMGRVYDYEMPAVRKIVRDASSNGYRWSSILTGVAGSAPFQASTITP